MPRQAVFIPKIEAELRRSKKGITTHDIAAKLGCSNQQVHKAVTGSLKEMVRKVGQSPTGGTLYLWKDTASEEPVKARISNATDVKLGDAYKVIEVRITKLKTTVVLEASDGQTIRVTS